jgi:hypothetical protein
MLEHPQVELLAQEGPGVLVDEVVNFALPLGFVSSADSFFVHRFKSGVRIAEIAI